MSKIYTVARFLHLIDDRNKLDIVDLSFVAIIIKLVISPNPDWSAVAAIVPVIMAKMQRVHVRSNQQ